MPHIRHATVEGSALAVAVAALVLVLSAPLAAQTLPLGRTIGFVATAYSLERATASGNAPKTGTVAADTDLLPLGTKIRVTKAGAYSGIYTVADTGRTVQGKQIDIYIPNAGQAKRFGRKVVRVTVLKLGEDE